MGRLKPGDIFTTGLYQNIYLVIQSPSVNKKSGDITEMRAMLVGSSLWEGALGKTWRFEEEVRTWKAASSYSFSSKFTKVDEVDDFKFGVPFVSTIRGVEKMLIASSGKDCGLYDLDGNYLCVINQNTKKILIRRGMFLNQFLVEFE